MVNAAGPAPVRVVIADDHAPTRAGVRVSLEADGFEVVAEGATARRGLELALEHRPDVCLFDVHMPGGGIAAAEQVGRALPGTAVVMLTYSRDDEDLFAALRAGAQGFLVKDMDPDRLGAALRGVLAGEAALPRNLVSKVLTEMRARPTDRLRPGKRPRARLTSREQEIMELLRDGLSTEQVAARLFVSAGTVRVHVSNVVKKLKVSDRDAAVAALDGDG